LPPSKRTFDGSVLGYNFDKVLDIPELMARMNPDKKADIEADRQGAASERHEPHQLDGADIDFRKLRFSEWPG
jgi:hypothetical protein